MSLLPPVRAAHEFDPTLMELDGTRYGVSREADSLRE